MQRFEISKVNSITPLALISLGIAGLAYWFGNLPLIGIALTLALALAAVRLNFSQLWQPFAFSCWVLVAVTLALFFPTAFMNVGSIKAASLINPLIQVVMFGMGTTLGLNDFARVLVMPKAVMVGMLLQFSVMPLTGWFLALAFGFPPEIAAGVVLIGACPGGVASNVITYLARGDVALSVTMTACSTIMSPVMTPLMMWLLAGQMVEVPVTDMAWVIMNIIILPTVAGLVANYFLNRIGWRGQWVDRLLSGMAMAAICIVVAIIVARSRENLLSIGVQVAAAAILHNSIGYLLGYWGARWMGLDEIACRTVSIEVGMQNGGMATSLAMTVLKSPTSALAGAIFGAWMNVSGSILASWWRSRVPNVEKHDAA